MELKWQLPSDNIFSRIARFGVGIVDVSVGADDQSRTVLVAADEKSGAVVGVLETRLGHHGTE